MEHIYQNSTNMGRHQKFWFKTLPKEIIETLWQWSSTPTDLHCNCINFPIFVRFQLVSWTLPSSWRLQRLTNIDRLKTTPEKTSRKKEIFEFQRKCYDHVISYRKLVLWWKFKPPTHFVGRDIGRNVRFLTHGKLPKKNENLKILFSSELACKIYFSLEADTISKSKNPKFWIVPSIIKQDLGK